MAIKAGEFFLQLGIIGGEKTLSGLGKTQKGMQNLVSSSFELKAQLLGAAYAFYRMMGAAGDRGAELTNFASITGLSIKKLQQWQEAGRQFLISNEEMAGSIQGVQKAMYEAVIKGKAPEAWGDFLKTTGFDVNRFEDTFYVMDKLKEYSKTLGAVRAQDFLSQFGLSAKTIGMMREFKGDISKINPMNMIGLGDAKTMARAQAGIEANIQHLNIGLSRIFMKDSGKILKGVTTLTKSFIEMANALGDVAIKVNFFERLGSFMEGIGNSLNLITGLIDYLKDGKVAKDNILNSFVDPEGFMKTEKGKKLLPKKVISNAQGGGPTVFSPMVPSTRFKESSKVINNNTTVEIVAPNADAKEVKKVFDNELRKTLKTVGGQ